MKTEKKTYTGLFEDEVSEIIRSLKDDDYIECDTITYRIPHAIYEDGIVTANKPAAYAKCYDRLGNTGITGIDSLVNKLSHNEFTVYQYVN